MKVKRPMRQFLLPLALLMVLLALLVPSQHTLFAQGEQDRWAGVISDENGLPIAASVTINGVEGEASVDGAFEIYVPRADDERYVINADLFGYVPVSQIHVGTAIERLNLTLKEPQRFEIDPSQPAEIEDERGTRISIGSNSLVDANGNPATGSLEMFIYTYDLTQEAMPGDMGALDDEGQPLALESAGVFYAGFRDAEGNRYNLAPDAQAQISIPVDESVEWGNSIPLWSYDQAKGLWIEEGQASQTNGRFTGSVSHFSWWNFDAEKRNPACIKLTVDPVFLATNSPIQVKAVLSSPTRVRNLSLTQTNNVLYNLPANAKVNFYMPPSSPTPFASVNTGAPWGGTGLPPHPYDDCNGTLHLDGSKPIGNYDARIELTEGVDITPSQTQLAAEVRLRQEFPDLAVTYERTTGAVRTLYNMTGYLGSENNGDHERIAREYVNAHLDLLGLTQADLADMEVTDSVYSEVTGATHLYWRQTHQELSLYNGQLHVNVNRDGRIISLNNAFMPNIAQAVNTTEPTLSAGGAVMSGALHIGIDLTEPPTELGPPEGAEQRTPVDNTEISLEAIEAYLMWLPVQRDDVRLVWRFQIHTLDSQHVYDITVDAVDGNVLTRFDWVDEDSYQVYPQPVESPNHTTPGPPSDGRVIITPPLAAASPHGWHDIDGSPGAEYTIMRGNNVHAYDDIDGNNAAPAIEPDCGPSLACIFPIDLTQHPHNYTSAAVANLFYWNNIIHDVQFLYGFDVPAGNFQENPYGATSGIGNDSVRAEAQDGGGLNNANFLTLPDGSRPRMQMYLWNQTSPLRDGDLEASIIVHEYGHGISKRLVGGPSNVSVLVNNQQPGEGISDLLALMYTHKVGDTGADPRAIGTYVLGQSTTGPGIRPQQYSTDSGINTYTYESINGLSVPHGVGSVWAQAAWEVYWALVDEHGFDSDLYNPMGGSGNQRMMLYVTEGLKNTAGASGTTFTDARDGIIQAATDNYSGEDVCLIWQAFADFGLGSDAVSGGPSSTSPTNGFSVPAGCTPTDVWVEDTPYDYAGPPDTGNEPDSNMTGLPMWKSKAIWVRNDNTPGPHQNPEFGQTNYVNVEVQNRGAATAYNTTVEVYWANASTGLSWPANWHLIGEDTISSLSSGGTQQVSIPWNPNGTGHYCLIVRIVSAQDPMTNPETSDINYNTRYNNNIAWRNTNVVDLLAFTSGIVEFTVRNIAAQATAIDLVFEERQNLLDEGGGVIVDLGPLFQPWQDAGGNGENIAVLNGTSVRLRSAPATIAGIPMEADEEQIIPMTAEAFEPMPGEGTSREYHLDVTQVVDGEPVGGVSYGIVTRAQDTDTDGDGIPDVNDDDDDNDGILDDDDPNPLDAAPGALSLTEVTPRYGLNDGPATMYIYGNGFSEPLTVTLGVSPTLDVNFVMLNEDPQRIRAVVPAGVTAGVYDITVQTDSGSATLPNAYEVLDAVTTDDLLSQPEWMWTDPLPMRVGFTNSSVGLVVQHLGGTATFDSVTVEFRLNNPGGELLGRSLTNLIAPDATESSGPVTWEPTEPNDPDDPPKDYTVCAIIDPDNVVAETNEDNNIICQTITVLPPHPDPNPSEPDPDTEPPEVDSFVIDDDASSTNQQAVKLDAAATDYPLDNASGMNAIKYIEFEYIHGARRWVQIQGAGTWLDYDTAQSDYDWDLIPSYGMRYMQAWASDNAQNISLKPGVDVIDLLPSEQADRVGRNGVIFYRIFLEEGERFAATMTPESGDPDMYVWLPNGSLQHNVNSTGPETVDFEAPFDGTYQIEIHGPSSGDADYRLEFGTSRRTQMDDPSAHSRSNKMLPEKPAVPLDEWPEFYDVGTPPLGTVNEGSTIYLPISIR